MGSTLSRVLALVLGTSIASAGWVAFRPKDSPKLAPTAVHLWRQSRIEAILTRAERRRDIIRDGMSDELPSWCGRYLHSNGFESHELDLGPEGFSYTSRSCTGTDAVSHGRIASVDGMHVRLEVEEQATLGEPIERSGRRDFRFSADIYVVPWSGVRFVVPAELMEEFCALVDAEGYDSMRFADYPHDAGPDPSGWDTPWPLHGRPRVPERFEQFLPPQGDVRGEER